MKDLLISLASNLSYQQLKPWVESFNSVNKTAERVVLLFNADKKTIEALDDAGFTIIAMTKPDSKGNLKYESATTHMNVERFLQFWIYLNDKRKEYRYILCCDSRDIVFQRDPFAWLDIILTKNLDVNFVASAEPYLYKDEVSWGAPNFFHSFGPAAFTHIQDRMIYNAGTIAGRSSYLIDLFASIYYLSVNNQVPNPDQAAYNLLLSLEPYKTMTHFSSSKEDFAAQIGILMHPKFDEKRQEPQPIWDGEDLYTINKTRYCILHQYDRDKNLLSYINKKFGVSIPEY